LEKTAIIVLNADPNYKKQYLYKHLKNIVNDFIQIRFFKSGKILLFIVSIFTLFYKFKNKNRKKGIDLYSIKSYY